MHCLLKQQKLFKLIKIILRDLLKHVVGYLQMELILLLFNFGYIAQLVGNYILIKKIRRQKNIEGLSFETQIIYLIGALVRCVWVFETRLTNTFTVWIELLLSVGSSSYLVYLFWKYKDSKFVQLQNPFKFLYLLIASAVLSFFFHPGNQGDYHFSMQMLVSFTMYFEACGLLPQIYILRKMREVEISLGHYMFCLALSRCIRILFWVLMHLEGDSFLSLMLADLIHTILLGDFVYFYLKRQSGQPLLLV